MIMAAVNYCGEINKRGEFKIRISYVLNRF